MTGQKNAPDFSGARAVPRRGMRDGARTSTGPDYSKQLDVEAIKAAIDPVEFFRRENGTMPPPKRRGWVDGGLCPFHADQRAGSFKVNTETGGFHCFSCHTSGGDVIDFVMRRDGLDFLAAVRELAPDAVPEHVRTTGRIPARDALKALQFEAVLVQGAAHTMAKGEAIPAKELKRLDLAVQRIHAVLEVAR